MPRSENEKNLAIADELNERINREIQNRNNMKKKQFVTAALEFFLAMPEGIMDKILLYPPGSDNFDKTVSLISAAGLQRMASAQGHTPVDDALTHKPTRRKTKKGKIAKSG